MAGSSKPSDTPASTPDDDFRWQAWLSRSEEGVFVLNRNRRLVYANRAWEKATGLILREVRGQPCRRRPRHVLAEKTELILGAMAPPPEVMDGRACQVRRLLPGIGREAVWVAVAYLPLGGRPALRGVLGVIKPLPAQPAAGPQPLPERLWALRDKRTYALESWDAGDAVATRIAAQVRLAAARPGLPVLLQGAPGTGKLWLARAIHQQSSWRERFFACLECDRLPAQVVADALWSQPPAATLGVVLLKEPQALPREMQEQLVHVLDASAEAPSLWIMAALRGDPSEEVRAGRLLEPLYCRLSVAAITLPPLAQRREQVAYFVDEFLKRRFADQAPPTITAEAMELLRGHSWPGNLHELDSVVAQAADLAGAGPMEPAHVPLYLKTAPPPRERSLPLDELLEKAERRLIALALRLAGDNKQKASEILGIWRARLIRRMTSFGSEPA